MKSLAFYLKGYKKESILAPLFKLLEVVFDLLVPVVVAQIIDVGVAQDDRTYVVQMFFVLILMAGVGLACSFTAQFFAAKASCGFAAKLRQAMFDHIQSLSFTELDTMGTDTLITRLTDDVNQVQNGLNLGLRLLLRSPFVVLGSMVMAFTINVKCAWIFVIAIPVLFVVVFSIMLVSIPLFKKVQNGLDRVTGLTRENLTGVRVIRAFCREEQSVEEFEDSSRELTRLNLFVGRISALMNPVTYIIINGATIVLIWTGAVRVDGGILTQGEVVALVNYMSQILVELIKLANLIINITKSIACGNRIESIMELESSIAEQTPADFAEKLKAGEEQETIVAFKNVGLAYQGAEEEALTDIDFEVKRGQTIGIIGGTGSGKSSVVNLIPRFYDVTRGQVLLHGIDVKEYPVSYLREIVGMVLQKAVLFKGSIRENLMWGNEQATDEEMMEALRIAQAKEIVEGKEGGLAYEIEQGGKNLSGGQRQRLTIARAIVKKPEILILDDSASALDFATDAKLRAAIREMKDTTVFIVSQRASSIQYADQIIVMEDGEMAGIGTHEELLANCEIYQEIYYSQFKRDEKAAGEAR